MGLKHDLVLGNYQTAWSYLHKMRRAIVREDRSALSVDVKVDETLVGGKIKEAKEDEKLGTRP